MSHRLLLRLPVTLALAAAVAAAQAEPVPSRSLTFEPTEDAGTFFARGANGVTYRFTGADVSARTPAGTVELKLVGASAAATLEALQPTGGVSHYYLGRDSANWRSHVPHHRELRARDVLPGVDLVHHAAGSDLEFDLVLRPGADWRGLRLAVIGAREPRLADDGSLALALPAAGELRLRPPLVWQERSGERAPVPCRYVVRGGAVAFELGPHDPALGLTIDPVVTFATLLGGSGTEVTTGVAVDRFGNMAITGTTTSTDFPLHNPLPTPSASTLGFVTKFDPSGALVFSTYFGGAGGTTAPVDLGMDLDGLITVGGNTTSANLPTTAGVVQPTLVGGGDWFFFTVNGNGALSWCTYYGGPGMQTGMRALKVVGTQRGSVIAVGNEAGFPLMGNAYSALGNIAVGGVFGGNVLWASTMCGFNGTPTDIDVTSQGHICITGYSLGNAGLPTTARSFQQFPRTNGSFDGFVFVFFGTADSLVFATYVGGSLSDTPRRIRATAGPGAVYCTIAGTTVSTDYPLQKPVQAQKGVGQDGFVTRLDGLGRALDFSTYLGGDDPGETVTGLDVDASGHTVVGGSSGQANSLPYRNTMKFVNPGSNRDVWLARFDPTGAALRFLTSWGGGGEETLADLAVGPEGEIVIGGHVGAANFPSTPNALPVALGTQDAFLARIDPSTHESYGSGTPGFWNFVPVLAGGGSAAIGKSLSFNVHDGRAQAPGILVFGLGRANLPFLNGAVLTNPAITLPITLRGSRANTFAERGGGYLHLTLPVPNNAALRNLVTDWQVFLVDAAGVGGVTMTNGVEVVIP